MEPAWEPGPAPSWAHLRAGDADRAQVLERLRVAHAEGRLEPAEFDARVSATIVARTYGDLALLVADLPGGTPPVRPVAEPTAEPLAQHADRPAGDRSLPRTLGTIMFLALLASVLAAMLFGASWAVAGYLAVGNTAYFLAAGLVDRLRRRG